ncbi:MAG: undecaprenyl-diphosphate phosphatase [Pseudomonadota bacterium]
MDLSQLIFLAIVQGVTEFLPISSSGHLILAPKLLDMGDQGVLIDIALHLGSLGAVVIYFWRDVRAVVFGPFQLVADLSRGQPMRWGSKLTLLLAIATLPLVIAGLSLSVLDDATNGEAIAGLRTIEVIGWTTLLYGIALWIADRFSPTDQKIENWSWSGAVLIGLSQALALVPGTSRSGVTMTAARFLGFERTEAARIALLMAVPAILAASAKLFLDLMEMDNVQMTQDAAIAALFSFISAYIALALMMRMLRTISFTPFVIYRLGLGTALLWIAYA